MYSNFQENPLSSDYDSDDSSFEDSDDLEEESKQEDKFFLNMTSYKDYEKIEICSIQKIF